MQRTIEAKITKIDEWYDPYSGSTIGGHQPVWIELTADWSNRVNKELFWLPERLKIRVRKDVAQGLGYGSVVVVTVEIPTIDDVS